MSDTPNQHSAPLVLSPEEVRLRQGFAYRLQRPTPWTLVACALIAMVHLAVVAAQFLLPRQLGLDAWPLQMVLVNGWKSGPSLAEGEAWRLLSSMWLHGGWLHVGVNLFALWSVGRLVERIYGSTLTVMVYTLAGLGGGLASWFWSSAPSVGASGALFGLLGALVALRIRPSARLPAQVGPTLWNAMLPWLVINVLLGLMVPNIDNAAHLGGFLVGLGWSLGWGVRPLDSPLERSRVTWTVLVLGVALAVAALAFAVNMFFACGVSPDALDVCYSDRYRALSSGEG